MILLKQSILYNGPLDTERRRVCSYNCVPSRIIGKTRFARQKLNKFSKHPKKKQKKNDVIFIYKFCMLIHIKPPIMKLRENNLLYTMGVMVKFGACKQICDRRFYL